MNPDEIFVPDWITDVLMERASDFRYGNTLLDLSIGGFNAIRHISDVMENERFVTDVLIGKIGATQEFLDRLHEMTKLAHEEEANGFPGLIGQAIVSLWGRLEAFVNDLLVAILVNDESARQIDIVSDVKVSITQYQSFQDDLERYAYILHRIEEQLRTKDKRGVDRFELMLGVFGLSGPIDRGVKTTLFELSNVRNVLVHRRGIADRRLADSCPWLKAVTGQPVPLSQEMFGRYQDASNDYMMLQLTRFGGHYGMDHDSSANESVETDEGFANP